jgi:hypothetical protein
MCVFVMRNPHKWAQGIRGFLLQIAQQTGDSPHREDLLGYFTICALAPQNTRSLNHQYRLFSQAAVRLFSVKGLFAHIVRIGGYPSALLPMEHYPYLTDNITLPLVAAWFVQHGIIPESNDVSILEDFARVRRNVQASITDLDNERWEDEPRGHSAMAMNSSEIPAWTAIHHAPRPTAAAAAVTSASDGINASMHAPLMEDVTPTPPVDPAAPAITIEEVLPSPPPETP